MELAGREREIDDLVRLATEGEPGIIRLTGRPGVGKSALLRAAVKAVPPQRCTVWPVDLRGSARGAELIDEIARALGLWSAADRGGAPETLATAVSTGRVLIAADHVDAVTEGHAALAALTERCPRLSVVLVSRRVDPSVAASGPGLALAPLAVPPEDATRVATLSAPSVQLFIRAAQRVQAALSLDDEEVAAIGEVCRLVGGLPLAIELAAARSRLLPLALLARQLGSRPGECADLDLLEGARIGIRDTLGATRALLTADEDRLLARLAGFHGRFPLGAVLAVAEAPLGEVLDALERLIDLGLVQPSPGRDADPEFTLLPMVRSFALEHSDDASAPVARYLRELAAEAAAAHARLAHSDAVDRLRALRRDVAVELRRLVATDLVAATSLAVDAAPVLEGYAEGAEVGEALEAAIQSDVMARLDEHTRAGVWLWSSRTLALSPDGVQYSALISERWERGNALIDPRERPLLALQARMIAALNGTTTGDLRLSLQAAMEGLAIARDAALPAWTARLELWAAGAAHHTQGPERAFALALAALERAQRIDDPASIAWAIMVISTMPRPTGPTSVPVPELEEALAVGERLGDPVLLSFAYAALAMREVRARRMAMAAYWCAQRLDLARRRGWWALSGISFADTVLIAGATQGDADADLTAARLVGVIRLDLDRLLRSMAPSSGPQFEAAVARIRARMGDHRFARAAAEGGMMSTPQAAALAVDWLRRHADTPLRASPAQAPLTPREGEVLQLLASGLTNKEIAGRLHLSVKTVMHHSVSIYRKLAVRGRAEATAYAYRNRLITDRGPTG
ncbi:MULTISPECIES: LuxR C-terminal-related transcriptional regulator [Microbacterium]|uniref:LuxR C-terminal-related transcriptional regulator n=1 Tax=Microbacterium TaxID=33882 RepID=UPI0013A55D2D|nr:LuxR C-terminal-related transcriptional regulator [Microbacterium sp. KCTC 39802]